MKKAILFGMGANYERYRKQFEKHYEIKGIADNSIEKIKSGAIAIENLQQVDYDLIVITTMRYEEIEDQLLKQGIPKNKIKIAALDDTLYRNEILGNYYYGQHCDDLVVSAIFSQIGIDRPSYMDLGANHPIILSNTALLYKNGCKGINIEANPNLIKYFDMLRPNDQNINVGVACEKGVLPYYIFTEDSGLNTFSKEEAEKASLPVKEIKELPVVTLDEVIEKYCEGVFPDYLDCDIEGLDYKVLDQYDLKANGPKVVCVEVRIDDCHRFDSMMQVKNYFRFCRIGENNIYVMSKYAEVLIHSDVNGLWNK